MNKVFPSIVYKRDVSPDSIVILSWWRLGARLQWQNAALPPTLPWNDVPREQLALDITNYRYRIHPESLLKAKAHRKPKPKKQLRKRPKNYKDVINKYLTKK